MGKDPIKKLAETVVQASLDTKAEDVFVFNLKGQSSFADYLIICHGTSIRQVGAIVDHIDEAVSKKLKKNPLSIEGGKNSSWVVIDYGDVVCHVLTTEARAFYRLEDLWFGAKRVHFRGRSTHRTLTGQTRQTRQTSLVRKKKK